MGLVGKLVSTCTLGLVPAGPTTSGLADYKGNKICVQADMTEDQYDPGFVSKYHVKDVQTKTCGDRGMGEAIENGVAASLGFTIYQKGA